MCHGASALMIVDMASIGGVPSAHTVETRERERARRRARRGARGTLLGWIAATGVAALGLSWLSLRHMTPAPCNGIGFGCSLSPGESLLVISVGLGLPMALIVLAIGTAFVHLLLATRRTASWSPGSVGTSAFFGAVLVTAACSPILRNLGRVLGFEF